MCGMGTTKKKTRHTKLTGRKADALAELELKTAADLERRRKRKKYPAGRGTRIAKDVRAAKRLPPPVPGGLTSDEIAQMDPDDPQFKHKVGQPRKDYDSDQVSWKEKAHSRDQKVVRKKRSKVRKHEAMVITKTQEDPRGQITHPAQKRDTNGEATDELVLIEEGQLSMDDWDEEELIRGYRRNRRGRFGQPPKFIPREVQQEALRRLMRKGERKLGAAYLDSIDELVSLARQADSEKVRLEAIKELQNRFVGKVPDHLRIAPEAPYQDMLADAFLPMSEALPLEMDVGEDGVARLGPGPAELEGGVESDSESSVTAQSASPSRQRSSTPQPKPRKPTPEPKRTPEDEHAEG